MLRVLPQVNPLGSYLRSTISKKFQIKYVPNNLLSQVLSEVRRDKVESSTFDNQI